MKMYLISAAIVLLSAWISYEYYPKLFPSYDLVESPITENFEERVDSGDLSKATFAGGCFWCMEPPFEKLPGVKSVTSGFAGGEEEQPSYKDVAYGLTGHREVVQIIYDPQIVTYSKLVETFWRQVDPTDSGGQFVDRGFQYSPAIFYHDEDQKSVAEASRTALEASGRFSEPLATPIEAFSSFYAAPDYHQDYYKKNPTRYKYYRGGSGRDDFIEAHWEDDIMEPELEETSENMSPYADFQKPSDAQLREFLTDLQYDVTQKDDTERPFDNEYWDNKEEGIYVDIVSGEPLYSSTHKYVSGTGWPSFYQAIDDDYLVKKKDWKLIYTRTELRSKYGDSHLGHLFSDGPEPTGLRHCINSAALRFIPREEMESEGYGEYLGLFES